MQNRVYPLGSSRALHVYLTDYISHKIRATAPLPLR